MFLYLTNQRSQTCREVGTESHGPFNDKERQPGCLETGNPAFYGNIIAEKRRGMRKSYLVYIRSIPFNNSKLIIERRETMQKPKSFSCKAAIFVLFLVLVLGAANAHATIIDYFTSRSAFDAAVPSALVQNWNSYVNGTVFLNGSTDNGITYNSSNGNALVTSAYLSTSPPNGLGETTNSYFVATDLMTFSFVTPIKAFGIDINTFNAVNGTFVATTNLSDVAPSGYDPFPGYSTGQFVGFVSNQAITSVTISVPVVNPDIDQSYTLATMRYAAVPVPPTVLLLGSGLMGLGLLRFRRKA